MLDVINLTPVVLTLKVYVIEFVVMVHAVVDTVEGLVCKIHEFDLVMKY